MASKVLLPNQSITQVVTNPGDNILLKSHPFGQVSLPKKTNEPSRSRQSIIPPLIEPQSPSLNFSQIWRKIQGSNNWQDLVNPLHPLLRQEIIRYGEFVTACYKAFNLDPNSQRYLTCKYGRDRLLNEVGLQNSGYEVTKYIYATSDVNVPGSNHEAKWIGYVAVSTNETEIRRLGRRDIVVAFRGTVTNPEWVASFMSSLTPARLDPLEPRPEVKVQSGFLNLYTSSEGDNCTKIGISSCREQLLSEISRLLKNYEGNNEEISISLAGHSMGSSLALLLGYDIAELGLNKIVRDSNLTQIPITVFSFAGPRVGNSGFKKRCDKLGVKALRIVNINDPITKLPGFILNENFSFDQWRCSCYAHVGVELVLDFFNVQNPSCVHDLETHIKLLRYGHKQINEDGDRMESITQAKIIDLNYLLPLKDGIFNLVDMINRGYDKSYRIKLLLIDYQFLVCMNCLAMYIFIWFCT